MFFRGDDEEGAPACDRREELLRVLQDQGSSQDALQQALNDVTAEDLIPANILAAAAERFAVLLVGVRSDFPFSEWTRT